MKRKIFVSLAALLVVGAGIIYAVHTGHLQMDTPAPDAKSVAQNAADGSVQSSAAQQEEINGLRRQVEELSAALTQSLEESTDAPEPASAQGSPASSALAVPTPETVTSPAVPVVKVFEAPPPAVPAAKENAGTVFEGWTVTVTDKDTPAVRAAGTGWPITKYYFVAEDGAYLGSISGAAMDAIIKKYQTGAGDAPGNGGEWEFWFAEQFNEYRNVRQRGYDKLEQGQNLQNGNDVGFDASALASEAFSLINKERSDAGLNEVNLDSTMMSAAQMRAEELEEKYNHIRPNGTRMSVEYKYAEIINRHANTAAIAVSSWMGSSGHREIILTEKYQSAGIGCFKGEDDTIYWCMLFSK